MQTSVSPSPPLTLFQSNAHMHAPIMAFVGKNLWGNNPGRWKETENKEKNILPNTE